MPDIPFLYKKDLRKQVMIILLCLIGYFVITLIVNSFVMIIGMFASGLFSEMMRIASDPSNIGMSYDELTAQVQSLTLESLGPWMGFASCAAAAIGACIMFALRGKRLVTSDLTHVNQRIHIPHFLQIIVLILGVGAVWALGEFLAQALMVPQGGSSSGGMLDETINALAKSFWGIAYIVLVGPIFEEIIFRGAIMRSLQRYGVNFSIVISSLLFGAYHMILFQSIFAFFVGLLLAYVCQRFSIKWAMLLHILNNGLSVLFLLLGVSDLGMVVFYAVALSGSVIIVIAQRKLIAAEIQRGRPVGMLDALGVPPGGYPPPPAAAWPGVPPTSYPPPAAAWLG
ncbi:MAG: CPBP family intramembrane metalloprotease, partial [Actinomycetia bacterium]|nr:CPBP family intramembrane metalloprotease [Actinomycetes bacterium]